MRAGADIVLFGTGSFAARILFDLAATARSKLNVAVVGRNRARLAWLRTAAAARADMFGTGVVCLARHVEALSPESAAPLLAELAPRVVANTASIQGGRVATDRPDRWTRLVQEAGLGITLLLQAKISRDIGRAMAMAAPSGHFVNCCYPDAVNPLLAACGVPVRCGIGNVAILAHAFASELEPGHPPLRLLAQHAALAAFRRAPEERQGEAPLRAWLGDEEIGEIYRRFRAVKLAAEPVIDISGASGVPLLEALAGRRDWRGHAPGPNGLPGGYPVRLRHGVLELDLPAGLDQAEAVAWNAAFEEHNGVLLGTDGRVRYSGRVEAVLRQASPDLATGFTAADFDAACEALAGLRARLRDAA